MADNLYSQSFAFPPMYPNPTDTAPLLSLPDTSDFATKYRAQAEILRRTGNIHPDNLPTLVLSTPEAQAGQGLFTDPRPVTSWMGWPQDHDQFSGAQEALNGTTNRYLPSLDDSKQSSLDKDLQAALSNHLLNNTQAIGFTLPNGVEYTQSSVYSHGDPNRRSSVDFSSDSSSTSHSVPSSTTSSNVHLPLEMSIVQQQQIPYPVSMDEMRRGIQELMALPQQETNGLSTQNNDYLSLPNGRVPSNQLQHQGSQGEGGFSSAFGLMSLDDPNMLANLSTDGAPFFSNAAINTLPQDPNATPMPPNQNQSRSTLPTPGSSSREAETRELREFWKQYMRTPLSGPGSSPFDAATTAQRRHPATPSNHRRVRVASFPSSKTPTADTDKQPQFLHNGVGEDGNTKATSNVRTTLHGNADDLRSYEAAVLARKAPTKLNIGPRARRNIAGSANSSPQVPSAPPSSLSSSMIRNKYEFVDSNGAANMNANASSRPGSSHSGPTPSFLANAFGKHLAAGGPGVGGSGHVTFANDRMNTSQSSHSHSRESSLSVEDTGSDREALRPSFKRLPSQTLGPAHAKRALLSHNGDGDEEGMRAGPDGNMPVSAGVGNPGNISKTLNGAVHPHSHYAHRPTVNLAERRRRMSAPGTSPTSLSLASAGQGIHHS